MAKRPKGALKKVVHWPNIHYHKVKRFRREEVSLTEAIEKIKNMKLTPHELKYYGLPENWQSIIPKNVVIRLAAALEKNKEAIKELERY